MRLLLLLVLVMFTAPWTAQADSKVNVLWKVRFTTSNGTGILSVPTDSYLAALKRCGVTPNLVANPDVFPVSALRCNGVLDLSQSPEIRARVDHRLALVQSEGHRAAFGIAIADLRRRLSTIDYGISPYGVFQSLLDGTGTARSMGLNVSQVHLVILNSKFWAQQEEAESGDPFLLHETLGALGEEDTDYALSNLLYSFSTTPHVEGDGDDDKPTQVAAREEGGATVIGRGGDSNQQIFKASLLRAADTQQIQLDGADPRFIPTAAELKRVINESPVTEAPAKFFPGKNLCTDPDTGADSPYACGGFVLHAQGGKPFLLITQDWGGFPDNVKYKLLLKIFRDIVISVAKDKQQ